MTQGLLLNIGRAWVEAAARREAPALTAAHAAAADEAAQQGFPQSVIDWLVALVVAPHGLTDAWTLPLIPMGLTYAVAGALGAVIPEQHLAWVGGLASVVHFSMDLGAAPSVAMVAGLVVLHECGRDFAAYCVLLTYMLVLHLPVHYTRVIPDTPAWCWLGLLAFTALSWKMQPLGLLKGSALCRRAAVALIAAHTVANLGLY